MPEDPAAYLEKHLIQPVLSELSEQCCRDLPTELTPYLIAKLSEKYPKAAETAAVPAEAKVWRPADDDGGAGSDDDEAAANRHRSAEALALAEEGCGQVAEAPSSRPFLVRCHVLRGTVHVALANGDSAEGAFADALALDEGLTLDPKTTSPKVLDSFERVRGSTP